MSIDSEIERIRQAIADAYESCQTMDATMPQVQNSDNLVGCISSIGVPKPKYYAYRDFLSRYVYCENLITSTDVYYDLMARSDNKKANGVSELTVPTRAKPKTIISTSVTFSTMPYYRSEQDDLY